LGGTMPPLFMAFPFVAESDWYKQQTEHLSDILAELLTDDDPAMACKALSETIASWEDYHEKELTKWKRLRALLGLGAGT
jgi:hypothetical protein